MLDILVYTDATAAESLSGSPGFQFVAHSSGATKTDEDVVEERLQHSLPAGLPADDWARHPATCTYARAKERMYLSRGTSTGATLGGRPGNQLTVTLMTSDPYDILPLRPAQLYSSPTWNFGRPPAQDIPEWETPVEINEDFDVPGLHALVVGDPWAAQVLPAALTMLEHTQAERRIRLLIRHPDQIVVMRWVALLSRFLDAESALALEFRVFADNPLGSNVHVVGVHPLLAPELTAEYAVRSGVNIIDLERHEVSPIEPSESATRYANWFTSGDPYEALEAIEVGRRWSRHMDGDVASAAAELATMDSAHAATDDRVLRTSLTAITALATAREIDELEAYGDELANFAASCAPTGPADLLAIDAAMWAAASAGDPELAQCLSLAALEWTAAQPSLLVDWAAAARPTADLEWPSDEARTHAAGLLATAINVATIESLPSAFTLAKYLNTGVAAEAVEPAIRNLADRWSADPGLTGQARRWVQAPAVVDRLASSLDSKLAAGDAAAMQSLIAGSWDWLAPTPWKVEPNLPVSRWFALRELRVADARRRAEVLDAVQRTLPVSAWRLLLPTATGLDPDEVVDWIKSHGDLDSTLATEIERILARVDHFPDWQRTGGAKVLHQIGKLGAGIPVSLRADIDSQAEIIRLFTQASKDKDQAVNTALRALGRQFSGRLNGLYGDWITKAVLESEDTRSAVALAEGRGRSGVIVNVQSVLEGELRKVTPTAMLSAVRLLDPVLGPWVDAAGDALNAIWDDTDTALIRERLLESVGGRLRQGEAAWLDGYLEAQSKGRFTRGVLRGARSIFGNKDK